MKFFEAVDSLGIRPGLSKNPLQPFAAELGSISSFLLPNQPAPQAQGGLGAKENVNPEILPRPRFPALGSTKIGLLPVLQAGFYAPHSLKSAPLRPTAEGADFEKNVEIPRNSSEAMEESSKPPSEARRLTGRRPARAPRDRSAGP